MHLKATCPIDSKKGIDIDYYNLQHFGHFSSECVVEQVNETNFSTKCGNHVKLSQTSYMITYFT